MRLDAVKKEAVPSSEYTILFSEYLIFFSRPFRYSPSALLDFRSAVLSADQIRCSGMLMRALPQAMSSPDI